MTPASLTDTLTANQKRHQQEEIAPGDDICTLCGEDWPCPDTQAYVAALALVAQIRSEAQAIAKRHVENPSAQYKCWTCHLPLPCPDRKAAAAILALTGDTEEHAT